MLIDVERKFAVAITGDDLFTVESRKLERLKMIQWMLEGIGEVMYDSAGRWTANGRSDDNPCRSFAVDGKAMPLSKDISISRG